MDINQLVSKNQSIKIVPSLEESIKSTGLNVELDENAQQWLIQLQNTWNTWKNNAAVESQIYYFFDSRPDPYRVALVFLLKICENCKDLKQKSLPYFIIETLHKWSLTNGLNCDDSLKLPAYRIAILQRNQHFLSLMIKTFQISSIKNEILPSVKDMIKNDNCKLASQVVVAAELSEDVPVQDLLFPLILQDKANMIDEYLLECPGQVKPLLKFLDNLLDRNFNIKEYVQIYIEENKISNVKYDKIHHKPLGKIVARLCNKYKIPIETCKNLSKNRTNSGLRYLIYQKYQENKVSSLVWDDLVKDSLRQNVESGIDFIDMLVEYDRIEALKWAEYLNLHENQLPLALKDMSLEDVIDTEEKWDTTENKQTYYKFSLPFDKVSMIDTGELFYDLINNNLTNCSIISIDCEWKPSFGAAQSQVALIQIATDDNVYLIDTVKLNNKEYTSFWYSFNKKILDNPEIIKLGFGLESDLNQLKSSIIGFNNIKVKGEGLLDMYLLWKSLINNGLILSSYCECGGGLSSIVQMCFGAPLEKSEQCSNWEIRPLRETQVCYAALDAYVLVELYNYFKKMCSQQGIMFDDICNDVMLDKKSKCLKKTKTFDKTQVSKLQFAKENQTVNSLKCIVEPNLSYLMAYLRYCGIDTTVILNSMLWHDVINLARSEERYILLTKLKLSPTSDFSQSSILDIGKNSATMQLKIVLSYFNITVTKQNLLCHCINCNSTEIKKLSINETQDICSKYLSGTTDSCNYNTYEEDDPYDNFLSESDEDDLLYQPVVNSIKNAACVTSKGTIIEINNADRLDKSNNISYLCEPCGKLFWVGDDEFKIIHDTVLNLTKCSIF